MKHTLPYPEIRITRHPYRVSLIEPWELGVQPFPINGDGLAYESSLLRVETGPLPGLCRLQVLTYESTPSANVCDGPSWAPHLRNAVAASAFHDPAYIERRAIAAAFGLDESAVRKWADCLFYRIMRGLGSRFPVPQLYYGGIRVGYPIFRLFNPEGSAD